MLRGSPQHRVCKNTCFLASVHGVNITSGPTLQCIWVPSWHTTIVATYLVGCSKWRHSMLTNSQSQACVPREKSTAHEGCI